MEFLAVFQNISWSVYKPYLTYFPWFALLLLWTMFGKFFKLALVIHRMKKKRLNPILINMRFLDGTSDTKVYERKEGQFTWGDHAHHYPSLSENFSINKFYAIPEAFYVEEQVEPIDPYLYKKVYAGDVIGRYEVLDQNGKKHIFKNVKLVPILPNRIDPKKYDTIIVNAHNLGKTAAGKKGELFLMILIGIFAIGCIGAYFGYLDYKDAGAIKSGIEAARLACMPTGG